jgi:hypothetical protein
MNVKLNLPGALTGSLLAQPSEQPLAVGQAPHAPRPVHLCIATPCYGGQVFQNYLLSLINFIYTVERRKDMDLSFIVRGGDSLITRSRNSIVAEFLSQPAYTHLMWIDADIGFSPEAIYRLLYSGHDIAAGVYPLKAFTFPDEIPAQSKEELFLRYTTYPFNPVGNTFKVENGFVEVKDAPTGLMLIKREVFTKMIAAYPELKYKPDRQIGLEKLADQIDDCYYNFFDTMIDEEGRYLSEDYSFGRLYQRLGGKVFVDAESKLTHQGSHQFQGDFQKMLNYRYTRQDGPLPQAVVPPTSVAPLAPVIASEPVSSAPVLKVEPKKKKTK